MKNTFTNTIPARNTGEADAAPTHSKRAADSASASRHRFGLELDAVVRNWAAWIGRRRNRAIWARWVQECPALAGVDPTVEHGTRIDIREQAEAIHGLMGIARSEPQAATALLALLAPVWMNAKKRYLSLEVAELASAMLSENLNVPSCRSAPVRAIVKKATRHSDRAYWVPTGDQPGRNDLSPVLAIKPAPADFVETLVTTAVISKVVKPGSCLHLRMTGHTPGQINTIIGSPKKARTRTLRERYVLAGELELTMAKRTLVRAA